MVAVAHRRLQGGQNGGKLIQRTKHVVAIKREYLRPQFGVARGDARRVVQTGSGQAEIFFRNSRDRAEATICGRWLVRANARSCSSGESRTTTEPRACQKFSKKSKSSALVFFVGVRMAMRPSNRSARAKVAPVFSLPARGWLPKKRHAHGRPWSNSATIVCLVLPASVNSVPSGQCMAALLHVFDNSADGRANDD